ncbi:MAG: protein-L-isoaspartate(D-aspartate) O-methyltransferase [Pseudomonadota bacterium]
MISRSNNHEQGRYAVARRRMVSEQLIPNGIKDERVLAAMSKVHREAFVDKGMTNQAYEDRPLQIGNGQTISQPWIVAKMTELLNLQGQEKVLEIGTGSGYQAAILAELVKEVYTIERLSTLSIRARQALNRFGYHNIFFKIGDGTLGWPEKGPYDGILVTAGAPVVPEALCQQLAENGTLIVPVGSEAVQRLMVIKRLGNNFRTQELTCCRFVKLIGQQGWHDG